MEELPEIVKTLTDKQVRYCQHYAQSGNALQSARLAGYAVDNVSNGIAYDLQRNPRIQAVIEWYREQLAAPAYTSPEKVTATLATMAYADIAAFVDDGWQVKSKSEIPQELLSAITGVEVRQSRSGEKLVKLKFNKEFALALLADIHGLRKDDQGNKQGFQLNIQLNQQVTADTTGPTGERVDYLNMDIGEQNQ